MLLENKRPSAVRGDLEQTDCNAMTVINGCPSTTQALTLGVVLVCLCGWLGSGGPRRRGIKCHL